MKKLKNIVVLFILPLILSCGTSSNIQKQESNLGLLEEMIATKTFGINADWALPQMTSALNSLGNAGLFPPGSAGSRINLVGIPNYLRVMGDSVSAYLPYYGERQLGGGYGTSNVISIKFEGRPEDLKIERRKKDDGYELSFGISHGMENYKVNLVLFQNLKAMIIVNSSQRFAMRYSGKAHKVQSEILPGKSLP